MGVYAIYYLKKINYWRQLSKHKFRNYRVSKGKRIPLPKGRYVEKTSFAIDTPSEKRGLTIAKLSKQPTKPLKWVRFKIKNNS
jgi:hypothetical protein